MCKEATKARWMAGQSKVGLRGQVGAEETGACALKYPALHVLNAMTPHGSAIPTKLDQSHLHKRGCLVANTCDSHSL